MRRGYARGKSEDPVGVHDDAYGVFMTVARYTPTKEDVEWPLIESTMSEQWITWKERSYDERLRYRSRASGTGTR
jgi:hypothetical protein